MKLGQWLLSLDGIHFLILSVFLGVGLSIAHLIFNSIKKKVEKSNDFAPDFETGPILYFLVASIIAGLLYGLIGSNLHTWIKTNM